MFLTIVTVAVASMAFGVLFNVRGFDLLLAGLCSALGYGVYLLVFNFNHSIALLCASATITLSSEVMARINHTPSTLFLVAGLIPLVPGGELFRFFVSLLASETSTALTHFINALLQAGILASGIVLVAACIHFFSLLKKNPGHYSGNDLQ